MQRFPQIGGTNIEIAPNKNRRVRHESADGEERNPESGGAPQCGEPRLRREAAQHRHHRSNPPERHHRKDRKWNGALMDNNDGRSKRRDVRQRELGGRTGEFAETGEDQHRRQRARSRAGRHEQRGDRGLKRDPGDGSVNSIRVESAARACRNLQGHAQHNKRQCADQ